jgi:serine/threonine-protein kinase
MADKIGKYELRGTLGRGAMGTVLDGWDPAIARRVAIKTVRLADAAADEEAAEALERFKREAQAAGRLSHANIVGVFDTGETDELAYIVMEFIEGRSLKELLDREKSLPADEAAEIMGQVLAGLEYSHRRGVVHRDIKPANIMLTADGEVKIADFGIARIASSTATAVGSILGTPAYMPPEQFLGEPADARSDIYAAGAMLFHLLTGTRPYEGNATSIMTRVLRADIAPRPSERSVSVSPAWDSVIAKAMAKRPEDRFQSAAAFAQAVKVAASGTVAAEAEAEEDATMVLSAPRASAAKVAIAEPVAEKKRGGLNLLMVGGGVIGIGAAAAIAWLVLSPGKPAPGPTVMPPPQISAPPHVPKPPPPPAPTPQMVRDTLAAATAALPCSFVEAELDGGSVSLRGMAGGATSPDAIRAAVSEAALPVANRVQTLPAEYCPLLDVLSPVMRTARLDITATDQPGPVLSDAFFHPTIANSPIGGALQVDYLTGDGTVLHVSPMAADRALHMVAEPQLQVPASTTVHLEKLLHNKFGPWIPFGTDMFVAIVSTGKLFPVLPAHSQKIAAYADALDAAIKHVQSSGGQVAAGIVLVQTGECPPTSKAKDCHVPAAKN